MSISWKSDLDELVKENIKKETSTNFGQMYGKIKVKEIMDYLKPTVFKSLTSTVEEIQSLCDREGNTAAARLLVTEVQRYHNFGYYFLLALREIGLNDLLMSISNNDEFRFKQPQNEAMITHDEKVFLNEIFGFFKHDTSYKTTRVSNVNTEQQQSESALPCPRKYEMPNNLNQLPPSYEDSEKIEKKTLPKTLYSVPTSENVTNDLGTERENATVVPTLNIGPNKVVSNSVNSNATSFHTTDYKVTERQIELQNPLSTLRSSEVEISESDESASLQISKNTNTTQESVDVETTLSNPANSILSKGKEENSVHGFYEELPDETLKTYSTTRKVIDNSHLIIPALAIGILILFNRHKLRFDL